MHELQEFFYRKEVEYSAMAESMARPQPNPACITLAQDKTEGRKTHKQAAPEDSGSKSLAKHHEGGNPAFGDVHGFQTSGTKVTFLLIILIIIYVIFICPKHQDTL